MSTPPSGSPGPEFDPPAPFPGPQPGREPGGPTGASFPTTDAGQRFPTGPDPHAPQAQGARYPTGDAPYPAPGTPYPGVPAAGSPQPALGGYPASGGELPAPVAGPERVGLGLVAAAVVVLICCALTAAIYHWGFIASITAWLMALGASWAYTRVGGQPVRGRVPLLVLILVGIVLGFLSMVASAVWDYYWNEMGSAGTTAEAFSVVLDNLFNGELWQDLGADALFYFLFAALGAFGVIRRMASVGRSRQ